MRYDKRCTLVCKTSQYYDTDLGKMVGGITEKVVSANISPVTVQLKNTLGDKLKDVTKIVRIRQYKEKVDYIIIDNQPFSIMETVEYGQRGKVFYVSEVKDG